MAKGKLRTPKTPKRITREYELKPGIKVKVSHPGATPKGKLEQYNAKRQYVVYRDKKGHYVAPEKLGRKYVRIEFYRYSQTTGRSKKLKSPHLKNPWMIRKKPISAKQQNKMMRKFFTSIGAQSVIFRDKLYAVTGSP